MNEILVLKNCNMFFKKMLVKIQESPTIEHCGIGFVRKEPYNKSYVFSETCFLDNIIPNNQNENLVHIPKSLSTAVIRYAFRKSEIPLIIHSHGLSYINGDRVSVSFSKQDISFIASFSESAYKNGLSECIFIVMDDNSFQWRIIKNNSTILLGDRIIYEN